MADQSPDCTKLYFEEEERKPEEERKSGEERKPEEERKLEEILEETRRIKADIRRIKADTRRIKADTRRIKAEREEFERRSEEHKRRSEEDKRRREEAERRIEEYKRRSEEDKRETRKTTLPEFLHACHDHLHCHLHSAALIQTEIRLSTQRHPGYERKHRPEKILLWREFPINMKAMWDKIMESDLVLDRLFHSIFDLGILEEFLGSRVKGRWSWRRMKEGEVDLNLLTIDQLPGISDTVPTIISHIFDPDNKELLEQLGLQAVEIPNRKKIFLSPERVSSIEKCIAAVMAVYKAPHLVPLKIIYEGLQDMDLHEVIRSTRTQQDCYRQLMAAIIVQAFSDMVIRGRKYGCIFTGEAFIFLEVPDDPRTVHYFLSVPTVDVGPTTGWPSDSKSTNRLYLTAVGQMLLFSLQAMKSQPGNAEWRDKASTMLNSWDVVFEELIKKLPWDNWSSLEYSSDTPSRPPSPPEKRHSSYCTQKCLLGLVMKGPLDTSCPNVRDHGENHHQIDQQTFLSLLRKQLAEYPDDFKAQFHPQGLRLAAGFPFRLTLNSHGYTVVAKAAPDDLVHCLKHEAIIYERLRPIQGLHVPVHLGDIDLERSIYNSCEELVHIMILSFGGDRITLSDRGQALPHSLTASNKSHITKLAHRSAKAMHDLGVLHGDLIPRKLVWNEETDQVFVIDFEDATLAEPKSALDDPNFELKDVYKEEGLGERRLLHWYLEALTYEGRRFY